MKKIYQRPSADMMTMNIKEILAASDYIVDNFGENPWIGGENNG